MTADSPALRGKPLEKIYIDARQYDDCGLPIVDVTIDTNKSGLYGLWTENPYGSGHPKNCNIEYIPKDISDKRVKQLEYALHCEIGRTKWVTNILGIEKPILDPPCVFCGYYGQGYWQIGTHDKNCPWHKWGGEAERNDMLPDIIRKLYNDRKTPESRG